jgi:anti-sigma regulatory factor (Ser/Thr protein kinase)
LRDLSLHILDLIENAIRAGATIISVTLSMNKETDLLEIMVDDNGPGLTVPVDTATNPFYTTKSGKRIGLGLSLFQAAVEKACGKLSLCRSKLGGLCVNAQMQISHIDRSPLGDLAATLSSIVCTNSNIDLRCRLSSGEREYTISVSDVMDSHESGEYCGLTVARRMNQKIKEALAALAVQD